MEKNRLETLPAIWSGLPSLGKLTCAVQENERKLTSILGNLVKDICVIAMQCLALRGRLFRIECSRIRGDPTTDSKAALLLNR